MKKKDDDVRFTVWLYYAEGTPELVRNLVTADEAARAALVASQSGGARCGMTRRVTILDDHDRLRFEWLYGAGVVFPQL